MILKFWHLVADFIWMAGMFYLPRILVYHSAVKVNSEADLLFRIMERRLMFFIMIPAMLVAVATGICMAIVENKYMEPWVHAKGLCVFIMVCINIFCEIARRRFAIGMNSNGALFYKFVNEFVTILFIIIVFFVVFKPFQG